MNLRRVLLGLCIALPANGQAWDRSTAMVSGNCGSASTPQTNPVIGSVPDSNCCNISIPGGFDLIPVGVLSKRLVIPFGEVNLQLSPYKRPKDRQPTYYIAGRDRAVRHNPKNPQPGTFDYDSSAKFNSTDHSDDIPPAVVDISNIRLGLPAWPEQESSGAKFILVRRSLWTCECPSDQRLGGSAMADVFTEHRPEFRSWDD